MRALLVLGLLILTGCGPSGKAALPPIPADIKTCFAAETEAPAGELTKADVMRLIASLRASEVSKTMCGKRLIGLYEDLI